MRATGSARSDISRHSRAMTTESGPSRLMLRRQPAIEWCCHQWRLSRWLVPVRRGLSASQWVSRSKQQRTRVH